MSETSCVVIHTCGHQEVHYILTDISEVEETRAFKRLGGMWCRWCKRGEKPPAHAIPENGLRPRSER